MVAFFFLHLQALEVSTLGRTGCCYDGIYIYMLRRRLTFIDANRTRVDKVNAELVTLTYGTIVSQLCHDYDSDYPEVNKQLDKMGYNIGLRLIEDFLARSNVGRCVNFRETADMVAKVVSLLLLQEEVYGLMIMDDC